MTDSILIAFACPFPTICLTLWVILLSTLYLPNSCDLTSQDNMVFKKTLLSYSSNRAHDSDPFDWTVLCECEENMLIFSNRVTEKKMD